MSGTVSTASNSTAIATTNESSSANSSKLGWGAGVGFGIGFFALLLVIAVLIWWLVRRRRRRRKQAVVAGDKESFNQDGQETGVAERIDGKAQLEDTQVMTPVHEMLEQSSEGDTKEFELVYELDGSHGPAQELAAGPLSNRHEAEGDQTIPPLKLVSPLSGRQPGTEDHEVSPLSNRT